MGWQGEEGRPTQSAQQLQRGEGHIQVGHPEHWAVPQSECLCVPTSAWPPGWGESWPA